MKEKTFLRLLFAVIVSGATILGFDTPIRAQENQQQIPRETSQEAQERRTQPSVDTNGRFRIFLEGGYGAGFDSPDIGKTTAGDDISISGGGGIGLGVGMGYGISRDVDLELNLGAQESSLTPSVQNAEGLFTRFYLLATIKHKIPTSDTGQFKVGLGAGTYSGGKLDVDATDGGGTQTIVRYDRAAGFHVTGEFERFMTKNAALSLGGRLYFVKYEANSARVGGSSVPVNSLRNDIRNLDGSGVDFMVRISRYF